MRYFILLSLFTFSCAEDNRQCSYQTYIPKVCTEGERQVGGYNINTCVFGNGEVKTTHFITCEEMDTYFKEVVYAPDWH